MRLLLPWLVAACAESTASPDPPTATADTDPAQSCDYQIIETTRADPILRGASADDLIAEFSLVATVFPTWWDAADRSIIVTFAPVGDHATVWQYSGAGEDCDQYSRMQVPFEVTLITGDGVLNETLPFEATLPSPDLQARVHLGPDRLEGTLDVTAAAPEVLSNHRTRLDVVAVARPLESDASGRIFVSGTPAPTTPGGTTTKPKTEVVIARW